MKKHNLNIILIVSLLYSLQQGFKLGSHSLSKKNKKKRKNEIVQNKVFYVSIFSSTS